MADTLALTTATGLRPWNATALDLFQGPTDYADFRFTLADGTKRTVLRVMANNDTRLYGEVIMDVGAFRSPATFSFTSSDSDAIASFRTGTGVGAEIFGLTADGQLSITPASNDNAVIYLDATASTTGRVFSIRSIAATGVLEFGQAASTNSEVRWGADGAGMDQRWYGDTASTYLLWDQSADALTRGGAAVDLHTQAGSGTGVVADVVGPDLTHGVKSVVFETTATFTSGQTEIALMTLPANSVVDWLQANVESTLSGGAGATFSIGVSGDADAYGTAWASGAQANLLVKNSKADFIGNKTAAGASMGLFIANAVSIKVFAAISGGTAVAASGFTAGSVKVRIGYRSLMSIADAP